MNWADVIKTHFDLAKFCPLCGTELDIESRLVGNPKLRQIAIEVKVCPNEHGELNAAWTHHRDGPRLEFKVTETLWSD